MSEFKIHLWNEEGKLGVFPPFSGGAWRKWFKKQDARKRTKKKIDEDIGYWLFAKSFRSSLHELASREGWEVVRGRPEIFETESEENYAGSEVSSKNSIHVAFGKMYLLPNAPPKLVNAAYKCLARIYHPDHGKPEEREELNRKMSELNEAKALIDRYMGS